VRCAKEYYNFYNTIPLEMHMAYNFAIQQNLKEVTKVLDIIGDRKFNSFVELGCSWGGTLWLYSNLFCTKDSDIMGLDSHEDRALTYTVEQIQKIRPKMTFNKNSTAIGQGVNLSIDLLHIDAGHTYEAASNDFRMWSPHVIKGGFILVHDVVLHPGVIQWFGEFSSQFSGDYKITKITEPPYTCGIAVMEKL
ncbi:unnamed protein product, partial [marine sediment metagenome]